MICGLWHPPGSWNVSSHRSVGDYCALGFNYLETEESESKSESTLTTQGDGV